MLLLAVGQRLVDPRGRAGSALRVPALRGAHSRPRDAGFLRPGRVGLDAPSHGTAVFKNDKGTVVGVRQPAFSCDLTWPGRASPPAA